MSLWQEIALGIVVGGSILGTLYYLTAAMCDRWIIHQIEMGKWHP